MDRDIGSNNYGTDRQSLNRSQRKSFHKRWNNYPFRILIQRNQLLIVNIFKKNYIFFQVQTKHKFFYFFEEKIFFANEYKFHMSCLKIINQHFESKKKILYILVGIIIPNPHKILPFDIFYTCLAGRQVKFFIFYIATESSFVNNFNLIRIYARKGF